MHRVLRDPDELNARIYHFPTSAIKEHGRKINYYDFLISAKNSDCNQALERIGSRINIDQILAFVNQVPAITDLQKEFYCKYIDARYHSILLPALDIVMSSQGSEYEFDEHDKEDELHDHDKDEYSGPSLSM